MDRAGERERWLNVKISVNPEAMGNLDVNAFKYSEQNEAHTHSRQSALTAGPISHHWQCVQCLG